jgi:hypothetical protein
MVYRADRNADRTAVVLRRYPFASSEPLLPDANRNTAAASLKKLAAISIWSDTVNASACFPIVVLKRYWTSSMPPEQRSGTFP